MSKWNYFVLCLSDSLFPFFNSRDNELSTRCVEAGGGIRKYGLPHPIPLKLCPLHALEENTSTAFTDKLKIQDWTGTYYSVSLRTFGLLTCGHFCWGRAESDRCRFPQLQPAFWYTAGGSEEALASRREPPPSFLPFRGMTFCRLLFPQCQAFIYPRYNNIPRPSTSPSISMAHPAFHF